MKTMLIYIDGPKAIAKTMRVITPTEKFNQNWVGLAEAVTGSNFKLGIRNYNTFELI